MISRIVPAAAALALAVVMSACSADKPPPDLRVSGEETVTRGARLVKGLAACGFCHGRTPDPEAPLSGGREFSDRHGPAAASNISPDTSTGIGSWSVTAFVRAMRSAMDPDDKERSTEVHQGYAWMSDPDLLSIAAYLRTVQPVKNEVKTRKLTFVDRNTTGLLESHMELEGFVPPIEQRFTIEYGRYLADQVAQCGLCHNGGGGLFGSGAYLIGGRTITFDGEEKVAPNITQSKTAGIGGWGEDGIIAFLKTGVTPDNHFVDPDFCPVKFYATAEESDLQSLARFLLTVPALQ